MLSAKIIYDGLSIPYEGQGGDDKRSYNPFPRDAEVGVQLHPVSTSNQG